MGRVIPLHKNGDNKNFDNCKPIVLLSYLWKIPGYMISLSRMIFSITPSIVRFKYFDGISIYTFVQKIYNV